ncbi:MAG: FHA domain-containing protein [Anaerolineae bacterium]
MRGLYLIDYDPALPEAERFRETAASALEPAGLRSYYADPQAVQSDRLLKTCQNIFLTSFAIFELSTPNPDILIEIGIALGLNKPFVVVRREGSPSIPILQNRTLLTYTDHARLAAALPKLARDLSERRRMKRLMSEYCAFCHQGCSGLKALSGTQRPFFFLLNNNFRQHYDLYHTYARAFRSTKLQGRALTQALADKSDEPLCKMRRNLQGAKFTLLDLGQPVEPAQYIALGVAIGMRTPWVLTIPRKVTPPALLTEMKQLKYDDFGDLAQKLTHHIYKMFAIGGTAELPDPKLAVTARLELPFWLQFEDWLARYKNHTMRSLHGVAHLLIKEGNQLIERRRLVPNTEVVIGRNPDCDVVINSPLVSRPHAMLSYQEQQIFVKDLNSRGGVFIEGKKVAPDEHTAIYLGQSFRLGASNFTVTLWNQPELPPEVQYQRPQSDFLPPLGITVSLRDGLVLDHQGELVARLSATETALLKMLHGKQGEVCTYEEIATTLYGKPNIAGLRMRLAAAINTLREKLEVNQDNPEFIVTVPSQGYKLLTRAGKLTLTQASNDLP